MHPPREYFADPFFQADRSQIRQRFSRDGENLVLSTAADGLVEAPDFAVQCIVAARAQHVGRFAGLVQEPSALSLRFVRSLAQKRGPLPVELLVLALELVAVFLRFGFFCGGVRQFACHQLLPRRDGVENRLIQIALHQPHQDEKVERLRDDGKPVDQHRLTSPAPER